MENIYAALLLHKAGKTVDEASMESVLKAAGIAADKALIKATVTALKDVDIEKTISEALVMPAAAGASVAAPKEEKKDTAPVEEKTEEDAAAGLGALFG